MDDLLLGILSNTIHEIGEEFQNLADAESHTAGAYGLMKITGAEHMAKASAYDVCAAKIRDLLDKMKGVE